MGAGLALQQRRNQGLKQTPDPEEVKPKQCAEDDDAQAPIEPIDGLLAIGLGVSLAGVRAWTGVERHGRYLAEGKAGVAPSGPGSRASPGAARQARVAALRASIRDAGCAGLSESAVVSYYPHKRHLRCVALKRTSESYSHSLANVGDGRAARAHQNTLEG